MRTVIRRFDRRLFVVGLLAAPLAAAAPSPVRVTVSTDLGAIVIELYPDKAPISVANFLAYADRHLLDGGSFYRTVGPWNDNNPATISVIQGGLNRDDGPLPSIIHETTKVTGLRHTDGVISMARDKPGSATADFFIAIGDLSSLDAKPDKPGDNVGFAAFGHVVDGMDIVRRIADAPTSPTAGEGAMKGQMLAPTIKILTARRVP